MKTTLKLLGTLCVLLLASCATSTNYGGGGGYSAKGGCVPGGPGQVANSSVEMNLFNVQFGGAMVGGPPVGRYAGGMNYGYGGGGYRPSMPCPPSGYGRQPMPPRRPMPSCGGNYGGNYGGQRRIQPQPYGYPGHAANPIMVNGVAFSDQYPGGVRVAPPR